MKKVIWIILIAIIVIGGYWYFTNKSNSVVNPGDEIMPPVQTENNPPATTGTTATSVKEFTVEGGEFYFKPATLTVNKGDTVKITFNNAGGFHDFVIDEFNARTSRINGGETATVTFVADKSGSFEYYCSVGQHRAMGMKGTLVVN